MNEKSEDKVIDTNDCFLLIDDLSDETNNTESDYFMNNTRCQFTDTKYEIWFSTKDTESSSSSTLDDKSVNEILFPDTSNSSCESQQIIRQPVLLNMNSTQQSSSTNNSCLEILLFSMNMNRTIPSKLNISTMMK